jgi:hypothetical protein
MDAYELEQLRRSVHYKDGAIVPLIPPNVAKQEIEQNDCYDKQEARQN